MPSILATAALAALSGGRKLSGDGITACSHDICGRKLLQHATSHGDPKFLKQTATGFTDTDFDTTVIDMDENGHQLYGEPQVTAKISSGTVVIEASFNTAAGGYIHGTDPAASHVCKLKVTPSIIGGESSPDGVTHKDFTSATFNPYSGHASVAEVEGVWSYDNPAVEAAGGKFTAEVADPTIVDASLGYLGLEYDVVLDCEHDKNGANPADVHIYHYNAGTIASPDYHKLRVRHKFVEHGTDKLDLTSDATTPITLTDPAAQWGSGAHKKMPVNIQASTTVQTESGAVRFPTDEWASGGAFGAQAKTASAKLSCQINQGTLVTDLTQGDNPISADWFDANAGGAAVEEEYGDLDDVQCVGDTDGVSCGISYTATIDATTDRALGFQVPLASYYSAVPSVACSETQNIQSTSKDVNIAGRGTHAIGNIKKSLTFTGLTPSVTEFGEGFFTLDSGANEKVFGSGKLFTVAQDGEAAWYDLLAGDGTYDYQWQLKYKKVGDDTTQFDESGAASADTGLIASLGDSLSAVQGALVDKVTDASSGIIATTKFARPTQYGEERHEYSIGTEEADAAFRRSKAEIQLTITGQTDGTLDYDGAVSAENTIGFPGYEETFTVSDAIITACDYCVEGTTGGRNNGVKLSTPDLSGTEQAAEWQLFEDDDANGKTDATLFDQSAAICDGSESKAWCVSKATDDDTVGRGTKVQCKDQSVTFQVTAAMAADDDRQLRDSDTVTRTYTDDAAAEPAKPTTAARAGIQYQLAGAKLTQKFDGVALATDPQNIDGDNGLTFTRPHDNAQGYSCSAAAGTVFTYTSPYYKFCTGESDPIEYDVATNVVYSPAHVKVSAALKANSAGTSAATIREYDLQGRQDDALGVDIEFTVTAGSLLKFDNSLQVKVKHSALSTGGTTLSVADGTCVLNDNGASADCKLAGFTDDGFDQSDTLDIDDHCGDVGEVECPSFALEVSQVFNVPKTDGSVGAFQPTSATAGDDCATSERHIISLQGSTSTAEDIDITIDVDGSEEIHREDVELFATFGEGADFNQKARFAHAAAESGTESTGKDGEYQTTLTLGDETTLLPANMANLNLKLNIHAEDNDSGGVAYTLENLGGSSYKMYLCANGATYDQCGTSELPSGGKSFTIWNGGQVPVYLRIDDAGGSGADPCLNKIKGTQAFGSEGIKFSIARNGERGHIYTVPITCHTSGTPTISYVAGPTNNGINWNQELLTVAVSGRSIDATQKVEILGISNNGQPVADGEFRTLEVDAEASLVTDPSADDYLQAVLTLQFEKDKAKCKDIEADVTFDGELRKQQLSCPESTLGVQGIQADSLVTPTATFGDVLALDMLITGRDGDRHGESVQLRASTGDDNSATGETVVFLDDQNQEVSEIELPDAGAAGASAKTAYIKVKPGTSGRIECNFMEIELSAFTVANDDTADSRKSLTFRMKCPRQQSAADAADTLDLAYDVTTFTYARGAMVIAVPEDPTGISISSVIGLGKCDGTTLVSDAGCRLVAGADNDLAGGEGGLDLFDTCKKHDYDGTTWGASTITSSATVARQYTKTDAVFGDSTFCGETPLSISVTTTKTTSISIAVADNNDMRFDVHMSELAWIEDTATCADGEYRLRAVVDMKRQLGVNTGGAFVPLKGTDGNDLPYVTDGIQSFYRSGLTGVTYYKDAIAGDGFAPADRTEDTGFKMFILGDCATADSAVRSLDFVMKVEEEGVDYFSHANINFQVDAPMSDDEDLDFDEGDVTSLTECGLVGADFTGAACGSGDIPSNFQVRLTVGVSDDTGEASAFRHTYSAPRIKQSAVDADCDLFATADNAATHCPLVSSLNPKSSYEAVLTVDGVTGGQDLVQGDGDDANSIVMLKTVPFAGDTAVEIGWTISRVENENGAGRRLRSVQHVTYKLGADGSVSKSSSFAVLPAVRDSEDASAVTTKEQITVENLDADGKVTDSYVYNQTTVQQEKSGEDHTLAVLGIVFGGLGSVAAIAVAFFVGCASRKDAQGVGSSFSTVAGGFSDRQPLFNRNRFAPSDF